MISFYLNIDQPFKWHYFKSLLCRDGTISKNKHWEFEIYYTSYALFTIELSTHFKGRDHAGPIIGINILGLEIDFGIYDNRHWDYDNNCWEEYDEEENV